MSKLLYKNIELTSVSEKAEKALEGFEGIAHAQGWDDKTRADILMGFVCDLKLAPELVNYAQDIADEENALFPPLDI